MKNLEKPFGWILSQKTLSITVALSNLTELILYNHVIMHFISIELWVWDILIAPENTEKSQVVKESQDNYFI